MVVEEASNKMAGNYGRRVTGGGVSDKGGEDDVGWVVVDSWWRTSVEGMGAEVGCSIRAVCRPLESGGFGERASAGVIRKRRRTIGRRDKRRGSTR